MLPSSSIFLAERESVCMFFIFKIREEVNLPPLGYWIRMHEGSKSPRDPHHCHGGGWCLRFLDHLWCLLLLLHADGPDAAWHARGPDAARHADGLWQVLECIHSDTACTETSCITGLRCISRLSLCSVAKCRIRDSANHSQSRAIRAIWSATS